MEFYGTGTPDFVYICTSIGWFYWMSSMYIRGYPSSASYLMTAFTEAPPNSTTTVASIISPVRDVY